MLKMIGKFIKPNKQLVRYSVLVVLSIITLATLLPNILWGISRLVNRYGNNIIVGLKIKELNDDDFKNINLPQWQQAFRTKFDIPLLVISIDYIYVPKSLIKDSSLCIDEMTVQSIEPRGRETTATLIKNTNTTCLQPGINYLIQEIPQEGKETQVFILDSLTNPYLYPFDERKLTFIIRTKAFYMNKPEDENKFRINPAVEVQSTPPIWFSRALIQEKLDHEEIQVIMSRPPLYKALSILMPFSVLLILSLLMKYRQNIDGFWEVIVGLVFGLWGLSEVLIPSYINYPTLISSIILLLFIPLGLFVTHDIWLYFLGEKPISTQRQL
jgi:hypothetical protein